MKIIGMYKDLRLIKGDNIWIVRNRATGKILLIGDEESCTKYFVMLITGFIEEEL